MIVVQHSARSSDLQGRTVAVDAATSSAVQPLLALTNTSSSWRTCSWTAAAAGGRPGSAVPVRNAAAVALQQQQQLTGFTTGPPGVSASATRQQCAPAVLCSKGSSSSSPCCWHAEGSRCCLLALPLCQAVPLTDQAIPSGRHSNGQHSNGQVAVTGWCAAPDISAPVWAAAGQCLSAFSQWTG